MVLFTLWLAAVIFVASKAICYSASVTLTFVIFLRICQSICCMCWRQWSATETWRWRWRCRLTPGNLNGIVIVGDKCGRSSSHRQTVIRFNFNVWTTRHHRRVHFLRFRWSANWAFDKFRQISIESNTKQRKTDAKKAKMEEFIERWKQTAAGKRV